MKSVLYWSPYLSNVATIKNVIKSALSLKKYSKIYKPIILDAFKEWQDYDEIFKKHGIQKDEISKLNLKEHYPFEGFLKSRLCSIIIIIWNFFPLLKYLKNNKPDYLIIHLLSSLPLFLLIFFKFKTKMILRISGLPKKNFLRFILWKIIAKKILFVTCPSEETRDMLIKKKIFSVSKIIVLYDPIIEINEINQSINKNVPINETLQKPYFLSIGRLTKQKNHVLLVHLLEFLRSKNIDMRIYILGSGENKKKLQRILNKKNLNQNIIFLGYKKNIFPYLKNCDAVISPSLWEDPGAVMVEASYARKSIICSDCPSGPKEFINNGKRGYIFKNNSISSMNEVVLNFLKDDDQIKLQKVKNAQKQVKNFTMVNHYRILVRALAYYQLK